MSLYEYVRPAHFQTVLQLSYSDIATAYGDAPEIVFPDLSGQSISALFAYNTTNESLFLSWSGDADQLILPASMTSLQEVCSLKFRLYVPPKPLWVRAASGTAPSEGILYLVYIV